MLVHQLEQLSRRAILQKHVDSVLVIEVAEKLHDVGMVQEGLDLDLPNELLLKLLPSNHTLVNDLQRKDKVGPDVFG